MTRTGWDIRVKSGTDFSTLMGIVPNFKTVSVTDEISGVGGGYCDIPLDDPLLGAPLPPGLHATRQVLVEGIYTDALSRSNSISPVTRYTSITNNHSQLFDVGSSQEQFIRFRIQGQQRGGTIYLAYTDASNHIYINYSTDPAFSNGNDVGVFLMNGGVKTALAVLDTGSVPSSGGDGTLWMAYFYRDPISGSGSAGFVPYDGGGFGNNYYSGGMIAGAWAGWTPGSKVGYDFTGLGTIDTSADATTETYAPQLPASFVAYAPRPDVVSLGNFPGISQPWTLWLPNVGTGSGTNQSQVELYNGGFQPAWAPSNVGSRHAASVVDVGNADGSWQITLENTSGGTHCPGLIVRASVGGNGIGIQPSGSGIGVGVGTYGGGSISLNPGTSYWPSGETWGDNDILRVVMNGTQLSVFRNSTLLGIYTCTSYTSNTLMGFIFTFSTGTQGYTASEMIAASNTAAYQLNFPRVTNPTFIGRSLVSISVDPTDLLSDENLWQAYEDGALRYEWLAENIDETIIADDQTKVVRVSGRGIGSVLQWGEVFPQGWPTPNGNDWTFNNVPVMAAFRVLFASCQDLGCLEFVSLNFDDLLDSEGIPWDDLSNVQVSVGENLLDILTRWCQLIGADWKMLPGFILDVRQTYGLHQETSVVFEPSNTVLSQGRQRKRQDIANYIGTKATTAATKHHKSQDYYAKQQDINSIARWHTRMKWLEAGDASSLNQASVVAAAALNQGKAEYTSLSISVIPDDPHRKMFEDYKSGDWVGIRTDDAALSGAYRAVALTVSLDENKDATGELTIQSKRDLAILRLQAAIDKLGYQSTSSTGATRIPITNAVSTPDLDDLLNVDTDSKTVGQSIKWNGSSWIPYTPSVTSTPKLSTLSDVDLTGLTNGDTIVWSSTGGRWVRSPAIVGIPSGGATGYVLKKVSGTSYNVSWQAEVGFADPTTTKGDILTRTSSVVTRLGVGADGLYLKADSTATTGLVWATLPATYTDPLTTKGDLLGRTVSSTVRIPIGTNGQALLADSTQTPGVRWGAVFTDPLTTKGDIVVRTGSATTRLAVGSDNKVLVADSTATEGVSWQDPSATGIALPTRQTVTYTTASLGAGATETGTVNLAKGYRLVKVQFSAAARLRVYGTTAERTADASRAWGVDPGVGVGLVLDYLATASGTWDLSPTVDGFSTETVPSVNIPLAITATAAGVVAVTFTYLRTE